ncbi:MAG TPA: phenol hydroxylase subunit [Rhodocyclaceae bacterium]|nr:phenol hydroxylase subunit [Rhodocyclaceae bacterium]
MASSQFDTSKKFVRVTEVRDNGLVEFEFSVGEPELAVELIMPRVAFDEFCKANAVTFLTSNGAPIDDSNSADSAWNWNLRSATHQRFR